MRQRSAVFILSAFVCLLCGICGRSEQRTWICGICGDVNDGLFCENCGNLLGSWICPKCRNANRGNTCGNCGEKKDVGINGLDDSANVNLVTELLDDRGMLAIASRKNILTEQRIAQEKKSRERTSVYRDEAAQKFAEYLRGKFSDNQMMVQNSSEE